MPRLIQNSARPVSQQRVVQDWMQVGTSIAFVIGSAFFHPGLPQGVYVSGLWCFGVATVVLMALSLSDIFEAPRLNSPVALMATVYFLGTLIYFIGTIFFAPGITHKMGPGPGATLFIIGSVVMMIVCLANAAHVGWSEHRVMVDDRLRSDRGASTWKRASEEAAPPAKVVAPAVEESSES